MDQIRNDMDTKRLHYQLFSITCCDLPVWQVCAHAELNVAEKSECHRERQLTNNSLLNG